MRKYIIIVVIGMVFLFSGCSLSHLGGKSQIEIEQYENPMVWREVVQIQVALWPLEKKVNQMEKKLDEIEKNVNEMKDVLATTKLSSTQANKNIETLQAEIEQIKRGSIGKEKTSVNMIRPAPDMPQEGSKSIEEYVKKKAVELQGEIKSKKETPKMGTAKVEGESKKAGPDIQSLVINDIQYHKISDTQDRVLIYVNAMNNPKLLLFKGEPPRIVLDFLNTRNVDKEKYDIPTDGNFIQRILVRSYKTPVQKVRVFFDMLPNKKYAVGQKFSKKEIMYSFDITAK